MKHSVQRDVILDVVKDSCDHPNAETILMRAKDKMPSINLATVYRNLSVLAKNKQILRIAVNDGDRFDKTVCPHMHFHCLICHSVFDVDSKSLKKMIFEIEKEKECQIEQIDLLITGVCQNCLLNKK